MTAKFSAEERKQRRFLGGTLRDGFRPIRPYQWRIDNGTLIEIPVTTMPIVIHPTDFLGCDDTEDLSFIPGMNLPGKQKMEFVSNVLRRLAAKFTVVTLQQHRPILMIYMVDVKEENREIIPTIVHVDGPEG